MREDGRRHLRACVHIYCRCLLRNQELREERWTLWRADGKDGHQGDAVVEGQRVKGNASLHRVSGVQAVCNSGVTKTQEMSNDN